MAQTYPYRFFQLGDYGRERVSVQQVLTAFMEISFLDDFSKKSEDNFWVLIQWDLYMNKYPKAASEVSIRTSIVDWHRFGLTRKFEMFQGDKRLGTGYSRWMKINGRTRRITSFPKTDLRELEAREVRDPYEFHKFQGGEPEISYEVPVLKKFYDVNGHVNNIRFIDCFFESLPFSLLKEIEIQFFSIRYKNEGANIQKVTVLREKEGQLVRGLLKGQGNLVFGEVTYSLG